MSVMSARCARRLCAAALLTVATSCSATAPPAAPAPPSAAVPAAPPTTSSSATASPEQGERPADECVLDDLRAELSDSEGSNQRTLRVVWTNTSARPCTMAGFGGVDLVASPRSEDRYSLPRSSAEPRTVRLDPEAQAHSTISYLPADGDEGYRATRLFATPPNETRSVVLEWTGGPVTDQRGATRPGTFLGPVQEGAS